MNLFMIYRVFLIYYFVSDTSSNNSQSMPKNLTSYVHVTLKCLLFCSEKTARSCHLSVLRINQTEELAIKRVFDVITLLITDYLIFLQV